MFKRQIKVKASGNGKELVPPQRHGGKKLEVSSQNEEQEPNVSS